MANLQTSQGVTREDFTRLLDAYAAAAMDVAIRQERNRPAWDQERAVTAAARARKAVEDAVFGP